MCRRMKACSPYELLSDGDLKREGDDLVDSWKNDAPEARPACDAAAPRSELCKRLYGRGEAGRDDCGVREPRRLRHRLLDVVAGHVAELRVAVEHAHVVGLVRVVLAERKEVELPVRVDDRSIPRVLSLAPVLASM